MGLPLSNDGKPVPSQAANAFGLIPKGAKNVDGGQGLPQIHHSAEGQSTSMLKTGLGRNIPCMQSIVKNDPWWLDPKDPHRVAMSRKVCSALQYRHSGSTIRLMPQVQNEHVWSVGWIDIMTGGVTPQAAAEKAFKRVEEIFAKYPILES